MKPGRGAIRVSGRDGVSLITSESKEPEEYPGGGKGMVWTGIWLRPIEKAGDKFSAHDPQVIGFLDDMFPIKD
jgi:hypothetical protein